MMKQTCFRVPGSSAPKCIRLGVHRLQGRKEVGWGVRLTPNNIY